MRYPYPPLSPPSVTTKSARGPTGLLVCLCPQTPASPFRREAQLPAPGSGGDLWSQRITWGDTGKARHTGRAPHVLTLL